MQRRLPVTRRDDEPFSDEQKDLPELDVAVLPAGGLQHEEERVAVDLELGPLMRLDRVLDGELVEVELASHRVELVLGRLVQAEPDERLGAEGPVGVLERQLPGPAAPLFVHGAVDDHEPKYRPARTWMEPAQPLESAGWIMHVACGSIAGSGSSPSPC